MANITPYQSDADPSISGPEHTWGGLGGALDIGLMVGYMGGEYAHNKLTKDAFYHAGNEKLVKGAKKFAANPLKQEAFNKYAKGAYQQYTARMAKEKGAQVLGEAAFTKALQKSAIKMGSAQVLGSALRMVNIYWMAPMLYGMTYHGFKGIQRLGYQLQKPNFGANMTLSTQAFTDRQRGIQAMHNSEFNGRSAIGKEAGLYHQ